MRHAGRLGQPIAHRARTTEGRVGAQVDGLDFVGFVLDEVLAEVVEPDVFLTLAPARQQADAGLARCRLDGLFAALHGGLLVLHQGHQLACVHGFFFSFQ
ncbi:hypothetical protein D9M69_549290 [compost metagenome]